MSSSEVGNSEDFLTLARLSLSGGPQDVQLFLSRIARRYRKVDPEVAEKITTLLSTPSSRGSALRREPSVPMPVDSDSRLHLIRMEQPSSKMAAPILTPEVSEQISNIVRERKLLSRLTKAGLEPSRSALFVGAPGVGKTLSARWIASQLGLPLLILDLSAVMSSFLGRTGNNVRAVLDYAKRQDCVLLLDELDAIAKRRDDATEIGELKRLVTVLLQEIDEWPATSILLAATNHPELLDPAVWRRFDMVVRFPDPSPADVARAIREFLGTDIQLSSEWVDILASVLSKNNYSDIQKNISALRRSATLDNKPIESKIEQYLNMVIQGLSGSEKVALADKLYAVGQISQRRVSELTGVSRDTLRKHSQKPKRLKLAGEVSHG